MAYLFVVEGRAVFPNPETLLISPFKEIWGRDKTKEKEKALEELTYIEFVSSMRRSNPYRQYSETEKESKVREDVITDPKWTPDSKVLLGIKKIEQFQKEASTTYSYYIAAKKALEKVAQFYMTFDMSERNPKTNVPIFKAADITRALDNTDKTLGNLKGLEKKVEEELYEEVKRQSGKEISFFAKRESM